MQFGYFPTLEADVDAGRVVIGFRNMEGQSVRHSLSTIEATDYAVRVLGFVRQLMLMRGQANPQPVGKYEDMASDDRFAFTEIDR